MIPGIDTGMVGYFIDWLPSIDWNECYVVMLLIRSKMLKKKFCFKGTDHTLSMRIVPGYHSDWRDRLYRVVLRYAVWKQYAPYLFMYTRYEPGTRTPKEYIQVPSELVGVMVSVNPADWVKVSVKAEEEFNMSLWEAMLNPEEASRLVRRIDLRIPALAMKHAKHRFHMIDLDTKNSNVIDDFEDRLRKTLGFIPARIETPHGYHYLIPVYRFDNDTAKKWFKEFLPSIPKLKKTYAEWLGIIDSRDIDKLVEYKKDFQEPVPGIPYQGDFIPVFRSEIE